MVDFGALPPEVNSARMYYGPGPGPLLTAGAAWDELSAQLERFAAGYSAVTSELSGQSWSGQASTAMADAAAPYTAWVTITAAQAGQAAGQARAAAAAYEAAFAATVPPAVVLANRTLLATLVATNFFGQNTPAIAATEAVYAEMWAQDAAAMYGYAAAASAATTLTPFSRPPQTINPAGQTGQGASVAQAVDTAVGHSQTSVSQLALPQQLQNLALGGSMNASATSTTAPSTPPLIAALRVFNELLRPVIFAAQFTKTPFYIGSFIAALPKTGVAASALPTLAKGTAAAAQTSSPEWVLASAGRAEPVGGLSVPPSWAVAPPAASPSTEPAESGFRVVPTWANRTKTQAGLPAVSHLPNGAERRGNKSAYRFRNRGFHMPRPTLGG